MSKSDVQDLWRRLKAWAVERHPGTIECLRPGALAQHIADVEEAFGQSLPAPYVESMLVHDGDNGYPTMWPEGFSLLPVGTALSCTRENFDVFSPDEVEDRPDLWRRNAADGIVALSGPVKPNVGRGRFVIMNEDTRYVALDFDPAPGGDVGQVIGIDIECITFEVFAPSFDVFLANYVGALEAGEWVVERDQITGRAFFQPALRTVPAYLADVASRRSDPHTAAQVERLLGEVARGEVVVYEGASTNLRGNSKQTLVTIVTAAGQKLTAFHDAGFTTGVAAYKHYNRIRAVRYEPTAHSAVPAHWKNRQPDLMVIEAEVVHKLPASEW